jgi:hypothetical protein
MIIPTGWMGAALGTLGRFKCHTFPLPKAEWKIRQCFYDEKAALPPNLLQTELHYTHFFYRTASGT